MDKYVKANRVKEKCAESCKYVRVGNEEYLSVGDVCKIVDEMPFGDVTEVVRCKDCKYCEEMTSKSGFCTSERSVLFIVRYTDYCSHGERINNG